MKPGVDGEMHRTMTLDVLYFLLGEIELELDSGQKRVFRAGDTLIQRGTVHKWRNVTPHDGWAKVLVFLQATAGELMAGGKIL